MNFRKLIGCFALATALGTGCTAGEPNVLGEPLGEPKTSIQEGDPVGVPFIKLAPAITETKWHSVALHGSALPNSIVVISSPRKGEQTVFVDAEGFFCVDVPLLASDEGDTAGVENKIVLYSQKGNLKSRDVVQNVLQKGTPPRTASLPPESERENLALDREIHVPDHIEVTKGEAPQVTDGSAQTSVRFAHANLYTFSDPATQILIPVGDSDGGTLQSIKVTRGTCDSDYDVFYSHEESPTLLARGWLGDTIASTEGWSPAPLQATNGKVLTYGPEDGIIRPDAQWVSVVMRTDNSCLTSFLNRYEIAEVEVIGTRAQSSSDDGPLEIQPSCQTLGQ